MKEGISSGQYLDAAKKAHLHAEKFLDRFSPEDLLQQPPQRDLRKIADIKRYIRLATFIADEWKLSVQPRDRFPKPGFASWLVSLGGGNQAIALDFRQMKKWETETGMPVSTQKIRSLIHEAGHHHMSFNVQPPLNPSAVFFSEATPEEEEKAWCYAMAFFGIILGRYALFARRNHSVDDTPKITI